MKNLFRGMLSFLIILLLSINITCASGIIDPGTSGGGGNTSSLTGGIVSVELQLRFVENKYTGAVNHLVHRKNFSGSGFLTSYLGHNLNTAEWKFNSKAELEAAVGGTVDITQEYLWYTRSIFTLQGGGTIDIWRKGPSSMSSDYTTYINNGGIKNASGAWILGSSQDDEILSLGGWSGGSEYCTSGKSQANKGTMPPALAYRLNIYNADESRNVLVDTSDGNLRKNEGISLSLAYPSFSLRYDEPYNGNSGYPPPTTEYTYVGWKIIYNTGASLFYPADGSLDSSFDSVSLTTGDTASINIVNPNTTVNLCFIWKKNSGGVINVRHLDNAGNVLTTTTKTVSTIALYAETIAYNTTAYGYSASNFANYTSTGYTYYCTPTSSRPVIAQILQPNKSINATFGVNDPNRYMWIDFYWNGTPVPSTNEYDILYSPPDSVNPPRFNWTDNDDVRVFYEPDATPYRRDPMTLNNSTYEKNTYATRSKSPETNGSYEQDITLNYKWTWREKHTSTSTDSEGNTTTRTWYTNKSDTVRVDCTYAGYWELHRIVASGNALRSGANISHNDTVNLNEGKRIELDSIPGIWDSHSWWVSLVVPSRPSLPSNGSGLSGRWTSSTNEDAYFRGSFPTPAKPPWNGNINPGIYNVDYTDPTVAIRANISSTSGPVKLSSILENTWYGGPGYEKITVIGTISDLLTTSYNRTGHKSGIWDGSLRDRTNAFLQSLVLGGVVETKLATKEHYGSSEVLGSEEVNTISQATGVHTAYLEVEDFATNTNDDTNTYLLDNTKPTITYSGAGEGSQTWFRTPFIIGLSFKDKDSGIDILQYRLENEAYTPGNDPWDKRDTTANEYVDTNEIKKSVDTGRTGQGVVARNNEVKEINFTMNINQDGEYYLYVDRIIDPVGNNFGTELKGPYKYDATRPSIDLNFSGRSYITTVGGKNRIEYISDRENKIEIAVWDNISGIANIEYALIKSGADITTEWQTLHAYNGTGNKYINDVTEKDNAYRATIDLDGTDLWKDMKSDHYYLHFRITDRAGNVTLITGTNTTDITNIHIEVRRPDDAKYNAIPIFINKAVPEYKDGFRISEIADPKWKATLEGDKYIPTREMPAYTNTIPSKIKLGYRVYFELDTIGYGHFMDDKINLKARYFVNTSQGYKEVYSYIPADKYASKYVYANWTKTLIRKTPWTGGLIDEPGVIKTIDFAKEEYKWFFEYYLRPDAKFVRKDSGAALTLDPSRADQASKFINTNASPNLLVLFEIDAYKSYDITNGGTINTRLDYTQQDNTWGDGTDPTSFGNKNPSGIDLILKGLGTIISPDPNHGETFWYDLQNTLIDDLQGNTEWSGN